MAPAAAGAGVAAVAAAGSVACCAEVTAATNKAAAKTDTMSLNCLFFTDSPSVPVLYIKSQPGASGLRT